MLLRNSDAKRSYGGRLLDSDQNLISLSDDQWRQHIPRLRGYYLSPQSGVRIWRLRRLCPRHSAELPLSLACPARANLPTPVS